MTKIIQPLIQTDYLSSILQEEDFKKFKDLTLELKDTWVKKQIFRTETEMRISVLSDYKHPNNASKYWQCIREQNVHFENLVALSFDYRKNDIEIKKIQKKLETEKDELELELIKVELDEKLYAKASMELVAKDRMRELLMIKMSTLTNQRLINIYLKIEQKLLLQDLLNLRCLM